MDLPISSKYRSTPNEPVNEDERGRLSVMLNDAFTEGTIDQTTYTELLNRVFGAQVLGDLIPVVEVVGKPATHDVPAIVAEGSGGRPGQLSEARKPAVPSALFLVGGTTMLVIAAVIALLLLVL